jgi:hypothetical protein
VTSLQQLVGRPVLIGGRHSGAVVDVVLRLDLSTALGAIVEDGASCRSFLPWGAARADADGLSAGTATAMLGEVELDYYLSSGIPLARVTGLPVEDAAGVANAVADVLVTEQGQTWALELHGAGHSRIVRLDEARVERVAGRPEQLSIDLRAAV